MKKVTETNNIEEQDVTAADEGFKPDERIRKDGASFMGFDIALITPSIPKDKNGRATGRWVFKPIIRTEDGEAFDIFDLSVDFDKKPRTFFCGNKGTIAYARTVNNVGLTSLSMIVDSVINAEGNAVPVAVKSRGGFKSLWAAFSSTVEFSLAQGLIRTDCNSVTSLPAALIRKMQKRRTAKAKFTNKEPTPFSVARDVCPAPDRPREGRDVPWDNVGGKSSLFIQVAVYETPADGVLEQPFKAIIHLKGAQYKAALNLLFTSSDEGKPLSAENNGFGRAFVPSETVIKIAPNPANDQTAPTIIDKATFKSLGIPEEAWTAEMHEEWWQPWEELLDLDIPVETQVKLLEDAFTTGVVRMALATNERWSHLIGELRDEPACVQDDWKETQSIRAAFEAGGTYAPAVPPSASAVPPSASAPRPPQAPQDNTRFPRPVVEQQGASTRVPRPVETDFSDEDSEHSTHGGSDGARTRSAAELLNGAGRARPVPPVPTKPTAGVAGGLAARLMQAHNNKGAPQ